LLIFFVVLQPEPLQMKLTEMFSRLPLSTATPASSLAFPPTSTVAACHPVTGLKPLTLQLPYPDIVIC
jgi:hypothetical protein